MKRLILPVAICAALGLAGGGGAVGSPTLFVTFHADHSITVTLADGTPVGTTNGTPSVIAPGKWTIAMDDAISVSGPQFDLQGPGVSLVDSMFLGEDPSETFSETFLPSSTYTWK